MDDFLYHQFADIERDHWWFRARRKVVAEVLRHRLPACPTRRILDVGCGTGGMLEMLTAFGPTVCGMDMSADAIAFCRERGLESKARLLQGKLPDDLPPEASQWDLVTAFDVIEHLDDDRAVLRDIRGVLAPGGVLVVTVPAFNFLWGPHDDLNFHKRRYSARMLRESLTDSGFRVEYASYFNTWLFPVVAAVRVLRRAVSFGKPTEPKSDFFMPRPAVNAALTRLFESEAALVPRIPLPVGVSLIAVAHPV